MHLGKPYCDVYTYCPHAFCSRHREKRTSSERGSSERASTERKRGAAISFGRRQPDAHSHAGYGRGAAPWISDAHKLIDQASGSFIVGCERRGFRVGAALDSFRPSAFVDRSYCRFTARTFAAGLVSGGGMDDRRSRPTSCSYESLRCRWAH